MSDAPERIWATVGFIGMDGDKPTGIVRGEFCTDPARRKGVAYVRADLAPDAAYVAGLQRIERSAFALKHYLEKSLNAGPLTNNPSREAAILSELFAALAAKPQAAPVRVVVKPLEWHKSAITPWLDDWHTVPTGYSIRCADENGWKWQGCGAHGYERSPEAAKATAQADHERRILSAIAGQP